jgi:putative ABC transport system substrate-binding protein
MTLSLASTLLTMPLPGSAQPAAKMPTVGVLLNSSATSNLPDLRRGLTELGYVEGQNIRLEVLSADGDLSRLPALAAELVRRPVDVIVASGPQGIRAARDATGRLPIVMGRMDDVDAHGLVTNLAHPDGNITGLSFQTGELAGKWVHLLKEAVPTLSRLAILWDQSGTHRQLTAAQEAAQALGLKTRVLDMQATPNIQGLIADARAGGAEGLIVLASPGITGIQGRLAQMALLAKLPAIYYHRDFAVAGGLMSYGPAPWDFSWRRAAMFVHKILKGAKPADLPVEQPTVFELIVNQKTARALGRVMPPAILIRADEVIQ